ncbi:MAG: TetR/AcrR family transcriptional regulator [Firmicutes bacterium]|nr:TetR/AcrR family transcriptional regulator [Bacillota bacterium]
MNREKLDTRSRIMKTAVEIIGREGNLNVTIREIAERAGVNIAAINYHFSSKENLIEEVERVTMEQIQLIYNRLIDDKETPRERLMAWADELMCYLIEYPGVIYMIGARILQSENKSAGLAEYLSTADIRLNPVVQELTGISEQKLLSFKALQLLSGVAYPTLIYSGTKKALGQIISNARVRKNYLISLIDSLARPGGSEQP